MTWESFDAEWHVQSDVTVPAGARDGKAAYVRDDGIRIDLFEDYRGIPSVRVTEASRTRWEFFTLHRYPDGRFRVRATSQAVTNAVRARPTIFTAVVRYAERAWPLQEGSTA